MVKHKYKNVILFILIIVILFLISYITKEIGDMIITQKQSKLLNSTKSNINLQNETKNAQNRMINESNIFEDNNAEYNNTGEIKKVEKNERMIKIEELQKENADIKAWIEIPDTAINYPVLQGIDNEFYVEHNYNKEKVKSGAIFIDMSYDWNIPSTNMLMYGHNMKNGTMFTSLLNYKKKSYFETHPNIRFTTNSSDTTYEIISAFESRIYSENEDVFKYYDFINANNENEFNEFITNIKKLSIYDTGKNAEYGEKLMTLSTCAYHTKNGRFVVVAKETR